LSFAETAALGAIAGLTIYIGLPLARMPRVGDRARVCLAMLSVGILAFIFMDVTSHGQEIVSSALDSFKNHHAGGGIAAAEDPAIAARARALRTGMVIATAIGLHNFAEGLAIGVSAKAGAIGLATVLIIGFGLHNATEGFGIVGPLGSVRPSWKWLALVGLIGGGPTFLGTLVGFQVTSDALELMFYALAGGAVLYVIGEIWTAMRRYGHRTLGLYMLAGGFLLGVATDLVVTYGGA
jgi:ZIP family zinc transporter